MWLSRKRIVVPRFSAEGYERAAELLSHRPEVLNHHLQATQVLHSTDSAQLAQTVLGSRLMRAMLAPVGTPVPLHDPAAVTNNDDHTGTLVFYKVQSSAFIGSRPG